jgi:hypothetical protein
VEEAVYRESFRDNLMRAQTVVQPLIIALFLLKRRHALVVQRHQRVVFLLLVTVLGPN